MVASRSSSRVCSLRSAWVRCRLAVGVATGASFTCRPARMYIRRRLYMPSGLFSCEPGGPVAITQRSSWMNDDLDAFRELAHTFCQKEIAPNHERWAEARQVDRDLWRKAGDVGLLCLSIPEEYGGGGGTFAHETVLLEEQAKAGDDAWGHVVHSGIVAHYVNSCGTEEQKRRWLPKLASGELVSAIAMTEPGTGSDLQNVRTKAIRDGDHYV